MGDIKEVYSKNLFTDIANKIKEVNPAFDDERFINEIFVEKNTKNLSSLSKQLR